ncbi:MAG: ribonuclease E inhibitor RraB [Pseudomonadota bacterium]
MSLLKENAAILQRIESEGRDLGPTRPIDFAHLFPDQASAEAFAKDADLRGFSTKIEHRETDGEWLDDSELKWDVTASREMSPTCENITDTEELLGAMARSYGGRADGWGFFNA